MSLCYDCDTIDCAIYAKHIECLAKFRQDWAPIHLNTCIYLESYAMTERLVKFGCPVDKDTTWYAARTGSTKILKLVHKAGAPLTVSTWSNATGFWMRRYLKKNKCPTIETTTRKVNVCESFSAEELAIIAEIEHELDS